VRERGIEREREIKKKRERERSREREREKERERKRERQCCHLRGCLPSLNFRRQLQLQHHSLCCNISCRHPCTSLCNVRLERFL